MANIQWPWGLPHQSLKTGFRLLPPELVARTDFDDGTARHRRRQRTAPWKAPQRWAWTEAEYLLFLGFWEHGLGHGAAWFDFPLWTVESYAVAACRFVGRFEPSLKGVTWTVDATLEVTNPAVLGREAINDRWPGTLP